MSGAEFFDSSPGHFFRVSDLWLQALHNARDTMLILRGETKQPKTRKGTNKRKPCWVFLKASKIENLRLHLKKTKLNYIIGIISPGCDVLSAQGVAVNMSNFSRRKVEPFDRIAGIKWNAVEFDQSLRMKNVFRLHQSD